MYEIVILFADNLTRVQYVSLYIADYVSGARRHMTRLYSHNTLINVECSKKGICKIRRTKKLLGRAVGSGKHISYIHMMYSIYEHRLFIS